MATIRLPDTITKAVAKLSGIDSLLTAKRWERAAIVYAFTVMPGSGGTPDRAKQRSELTFDEFAKLGIAGLKSKNTVQRYHELWAAHGDPNLQLGDEAELPTIGFPPAPDSNFGSRQSPEKAVARFNDLQPEAQEAVAVAVAKHPELASELLKDPEVVEAVTSAIANDPSATAQVASKVEAKRPKTKSSAGTDRGLVGVTSLAALLDTLDNAVLVLEERLPEFTAALRDNTVPNGDHIAEEWQTKLTIAAEMLELATVETL